MIGQRPELTSTPQITRFAPSPTGHLHLGNVRTAAVNWVVARASGGEFRLRIEDTSEDGEEGREYVDEIVSALRWLGLDWDGPILHQRDREETYRSYLTRLIRDDHVYPCFCTQQRLDALRQDLRKARVPPTYDGRCRSIAASEAQRRIGAGEDHAWRFSVPKSGFTLVDDVVQGTKKVLNVAIADFVVSRSASRGGRTTFLLANALDDYETGVTVVIRGEDQLPSTPKQILLREVLGLSHPRYAHLPLVKGPEGRKQGKRQGAASVLQYRRMGYPAGALVSYLLSLGRTGGGTCRDDLGTVTASFRLESLGRRQPRLDPKALQSCCANFIKALSLGELEATVRDFAEFRGISLARWSDDQLVALARLWQTRLRTLSDLVFVLEPPPGPYSRASRAHLEDTAARAFLTRLAAALGPDTSFDAKTLEELLWREAAAAGLSREDAAATVRIAVSDLRVTPPLIELMRLLGKEEVVRRLENAVRL